MTDNIQLLADIYEALEASNFCGKTFFKLWSKKFEAADFVFESLKTEQMEKICAYMKKEYEKKSILNYLSGKDLTGCYGDCKCRLQLKVEREKKKNYTKEKGSSHNTVEIVFANDQNFDTKVFKPLSFIERKFYRRKPSYYEEESMARLELATENPWNIHDPNENRYLYKRQS